MRSTVAILITYHNERTYLLECLNSLFQNEILPDEVIIYDDNSQYPAVDYAPKEYPVKIIRGNESRGPSYARNVLLGVASSEYVHFHDADDLFDKKFCGKVISILETTLIKPDLIFTNWRWQDSEDFPRRSTQLQNLNNDLVSLFIRFGANTPNTTFRRELALQLGGYDTKDLITSLDLYFNITLAAKIETFAILDEALTIVRKTSSSLTRDKHGNEKKLQNAKSRIAAMCYLSIDLPPKYRDDLADQIAGMAAYLFDNGFIADAREALRVAHQIGTPRYLIFSEPKRLMIKTIGLELTLLFGQLYRSILPRKLRMLAHRGTTSLL